MEGGGDGGDGGGGSGGDVEKAILLSARRISFGGVPVVSAGQRYIPSLFSSNFQ